MSPERASCPKTSSKWWFLWRKTSSLFHPIQPFLRYSYVLVQDIFGALNQLIDDLVHPMLIALGGFVSTVPKFTNWREGKIKKAVTSATALDLEALYWFYEISSATSVHRIIARCAFMHRNVTRRFELVILDNFWRILEVNETNIMDFRHGLYVDLLSRECSYWSLLASIPNVELERQLNKMEYQNYSRIAKNVIDHNYVQILKDAIKDDLKLPLAMWQCFFARASGDDTVAAYILTFEPSYLFYWNADNSTYSTDFVSFQTVLKDIDESRKWKFDYLFRYFHHGSPDYSSEGKSFETCYLLLVSIFRNLISDQPLITDKEQKQKSLYILFINFWIWLHFTTQHLSSEQYLAFFIDICCVDAFWSESSTHDVRLTAVQCLNKVWNSMDTDVVNRLCFYGVLRPYTHISMVFTGSPSRFLKVHISRIHTVVHVTEPRTSMHNPLG